MKNETSSGFGEPLRVGAQEQDASDPVDGQGSSVKQTTEQILFDNAWQIVEKSHSVASWNDSSSKIEALRLLTEETSVFALSAFVQSSTWKQQLDIPRLVMLPGLSLKRGVLYRDSVWSYDESIEMREVFDKIAKLYELSRGNLSQLSPYEQRRLLEDDTATAAVVRLARLPLVESVRHEVWRRDQGKCVQCGSKEKLEFDHIIPFSRGGSDTARNIQLLCELCNRTKRATV